MDKEEKQRILNVTKQFFKEKLINNHIKNTRKLRLKDFNRNPLLENYLANYAFGNSSNESIAKILIYPRLLGTSITTSFGTLVQQMCSQVLQAYASIGTGMDIEYNSAIDSQKKYCQLKAGPQTINKDDIKTICDHFKSLKSLGRTNSLKITDDDCVVGVLYGDRSDLSANYKRIEEEGFKVLIGNEFWTDLTGDKSFYSELIKEIGSVAANVNASKELKAAIDRIKKELDGQSSSH